MSAWVNPDSHGRVFYPKSDRDWRAVLRECEGGPSFAGVLSIARRNRCRSVVVEERYVDIDYRSDYSAFWSKRFNAVSPFARRVHFFRKRLAESQLHRLPTRAGYLGYSVLRPTPHAEGRVGRTVLTPPPQLRHATMACVNDEVSLFGNRLTIAGAPFSEQDGEFLRCAHAAIWGCHYSAFRRGLTGRRSTAELADLVPALLSPRRALPSPGMKPEQIQAVFASTGQPALIYAIDQLPEVLGVDNPQPQLDARGNRRSGGYWDTRIFSIVCRYLNSGFPVMVITGNHAFNIVGWFIRNKRIRLVACDDQRYPYEVIDSPFSDHRAPWVGIMVPLPPKVFLSGEMAENWAHRTLSSIGANESVPSDWRAISEALAVTPKGVSLRSFLRDSRDYKACLTGQGRSQATVQALRLARLPHYIWVIEAQDRKRREAGKPCVLAEVLFDPDSSDHKHRPPRRDSLSMPGLTVISPPDGGHPVPIREPARPWRSQLA
jgi:hypothetical protein